MNLSFRTVAVILHDVLAAAFAWLAAYFLRFNLTLPAEYQSAALSTLVSEVRHFADDFAPFPASATFEIKRLGRSGQKVL